MSFNLSDYETVADRVKRFQTLFPSGKILTEIISHDSAKGEVLAKAFVFRQAEDSLAAASDFAFGIASTYPVSMRKFYVEDTVTSAVGRALSLILETGNKPTREDMAKVQAHEEVKNKVTDTKAKMAETSKEYIPTPNPDDPWTTWESPQAQTAEQAISAVQEVIGAEVTKEVPRCTKCHDHKEMTWKTGVSPKNNKPWGNFSCWVCKETLWYEVAPDGTWKPQKVWSK